MGIVMVPTGPGLGIEIDRYFWAKYNVALNPVFPTKPRRAAGWDDGSLK
jgi:hypothetical protein